MKQTVRNQLRIQESFYRWSITYAQIYERVNNNIACCPPASANAMTGHKKLRNSQLLVPPYIKLSHEVFRRTGGQQTLLSYLLSGEIVA